jgi:methionyl-tRNA formyltransferase
MRHVAHDDAGARAMNVLLLLGDFGMPTLLALLTSRHRPVCAVVEAVTQAPPQGTPSERLRARVRPLLWRGTSRPLPADLRPWTATAVLRRERIPALAGPDLPLAEVQRLGETHRADVLLSAGYPRLLPAALLERFRYGGLNVHPSLLPAYRGPSPVFWQIALGEERSGVTVHRMVAQVDGGPILSQQEARIGSEETTGELFLRLARLAASLVVETLDRLEAGTTRERPQDPRAGSAQRRARPDDSRIDWSRGAAEVARLVRACSPAPGARTTLAGETVRLWRAHATGAAATGAPGEVAAVDRSGFEVSARDGLVRVRSATSDDGRRFPRWGRGWPALRPGARFLPETAARDGGAR